MDPTKTYLLSLVIAVLLDLYWVWGWRRLRIIRCREEAPRAVFVHAFTPDWLQSLFGRLPESVRQALHPRGWWRETLEIILLLAWALWVGRDYLDLNPHVVPAGREFGSAIQAHHLWTRVKTCGWCALWDGSERGGFPAFADPLASALHPLVMVTTLLYGVVNGAKISLILTLWFAGIAQWWLGNALGLRRLPRMWGALMVMVAGHLSGRMELGIFSMVLSTAMAAFTLAPAIRLAQTGARKYVIAFAVTLALLIVAGQGYIQAGWIFVSPALFVLMLSPDGRRNRIWRKYLLAAGFALLLAAPFLVPFGHFFPNFVKDGDPSFRAAQPLPYYLLNLLIDDHHFYTTTELGKLPYPHLYTLFIGWIPFLLALLSLLFWRKKEAPWLGYLWAVALLALFVGSVLPLRWLQPLIPQLSALRFAPVIGGLAIAPLIALASYSLDKLLALPYPKLVLFSARPLHLSVLSLSLIWLWVFPLFWSLRSGYDFARQWLYTGTIGSGVYQLLEAMKTPSLTWIQPPFGEHFFIEPAVGMGLKLSPGIMTWRWKGRDFPEPALEATRGGPPTEGALYLTTVNGVKVYARPAQPYAAVYDLISQEYIACSAHGLGGVLEVICDTPFNGGTLVVQENAWVGWRVWLDGEPAPLTGTGWLETPARAGIHRYRFVYLPWDVPLGLFLMLIGIGLCGWYWRAGARSGYATV